MNEGGDGPYSRESALERMKRTRWRSPLRIEYLLQAKCQVLTNYNPLQIIQEILPVRPKSFSNPFNRAAVTAVR